MSESAVEIVDNPTEERFEARLDGAVVAFSEYRLVDETITFVHTETDPAFEGRGIGGQLASGALGQAQARGLRIRSKCPFITAYIRRHREYAHLR